MDTIRAVFNSNWFLGVMLCVYLHLDRPRSGQ